MTIENGRPRPPVTSTSLIVLTLARRVETELNASLAPLELTIAKLGLLGHISGMPGVSFSELARMSGITVQSVHAAAKSMVTAGLVRDRTAKAGSASVIELTAEGVDLLRAARRVVDDVDNRMFGSAADPVMRQIGAGFRAAFADKSES